MARGPGAARRLQPPGRAPGPRDPRPHRPRGADRAPESPHRHAARPRRRPDRRRRFALPCARSAPGGAWRRRCAAAAAPAAERITIAGGLVLDSVPGLYRNILVFDFKSLYPSLIRTFNIDPLAHVGRRAGRRTRTLVRTPSGARFRRRRAGILPELVARLWEERAQARAPAATAVGAQATKILMNSLFGVLGASASRLFSPAVANAITMAGQHVIRLAAAAVEREPATASSTATPIRSSSTSASRTAGRAAARARRSAGRSAPTSRTRWAASSACGAGSSSSSRRSTPASSCPRCASGATGSKKRYAGLVAGPDGETLELVGLEAVRRDWSAVARRFQRELLDRVFHDRPSRTSSGVSWPTSAPAASMPSSPTGRRSASRSTPTRRQRRPTSRRRASRPAGRAGSSPT